MVATDGLYTHRFTGGYNKLEPYTMFVWPFSDIWQCLWHPEPFHGFRFRSSAKTFNGWLPLNVFAGWLCPMCVTGTWVPSWSDVIIIRYHYIVICTLVTVFNWWLSSKDIKLRVVFHWFTFRIMLLLFWNLRQKVGFESFVISIWIYMYIYICFIYICIDIYIYIYIYVCIYKYKAQHPVLWAIWWH